MAQAAQGCGPEQGYVIADNLCEDARPPARSGTRSGSRAKCVSHLGTKDNGRPCSGGYRRTAPRAVPETGQTPGASSQPPALRRRRRVLDEFVIVASCGISASVRASGSVSPECGKGTIPVGINRK